MDLTICDGIKCLMVGVLYMHVVITKINKYRARGRPLTYQTEADPICLKQSFSLHQQFQEGHLYGLYLDPKVLHLLSSSKVKISQQPPWIVVYFKELISHRQPIQMSCCSSGNPWRRLLCAWSSSGDAIGYCMM